MDILEDVIRQRDERVANDMAIAKALCEPQIEEEVPYEVEFEGSTQSSADEQKPTLTKRIPLKRRERADECQHRLPYNNHMLVLE